MNKSNRITLIITAIASSIVSIVLFIGLLLGFDQLYTPAAEPIEQKEATEVVEEIKEIDIIDEDDFLDGDSEAFMREKVVFIADKRFEVDSMTLWFNEFEGGSTMAVVDLYISNASLGKIMSEQHGTQHDMDERQELCDEVLTNVTRVQEILEDKLTINTTVQFRTEDMNGLIFMSVDGTGVKYDSFELTGHEEE